MTVFQFGQRENMTQQKYVTPEELYQMFHDETIEMISFEMVGEGDAAQMLLNYRMEEEFVQPLENVNVIIACFVTAHARLRLYSYLETLQSRVLYFDTG